jgi:hypothetical protein
MKSASKVVFLFRRADVEAILLLFPPSVTLLPPPRPFLLKEQCHKMDIYLERS